MADTLTYEAVEPQAPEFTDEELDSLRVGEEIVQQQDQLLAGKYANAQELEKGYLALEKKLGQPKQDQAEPTPESTSEPTPDSESTLEIESTEPDESKEVIDTSFLDKLYDESKGNKFTDETLKELSEMGTDKLAKMYLEERYNRPKETLPPIKPFTKEEQKKLKNVVGGEAPYNSMLGWAKANLQKNEIEMFDTVIKRGDPLSAFFAVQALYGRYTESQGSEPQLVTGKASNSVPKDEFRSQAELVRAMNDDRYDRDPAYRQDVMKKLERSNVNF